MLLRDVEKIIGDIKASFEKYGDKYIGVIETKRAIEGVLYFSNSFCDLDEDYRSFFLSQILTKVKPDSYLLTYYNTNKILLNEKDIDILFKKSLVTRLSFLIFLFKYTHYFVDRLVNFINLKVLSNGKDISIAELFLHLYKYSSSSIDIEIFPLDKTNARISINHIDESLSLKTMLSNPFLSKIGSTYLADKAKFMLLNKDEVIRDLHLIKKVFDIKKEDYNVFNSRGKLFY